MSTHLEPELESGSAAQTAADQVEADAEPREWESALLSICMFGGLVIFGVSCTLFGWG